MKNSHRMRLLIVVLLLVVPSLVSAHGRQNEASGCTADSMEYVLPRLIACEIVDMEKNSVAGGMELTKALSLFLENNERGGSVRYVYRYVPYLVVRLVEMSGKGCDDLPYYEIRVWDRARTDDEIYNKPGGYLVCGGNVFVVSDEIVKIAGLQALENGEPLSIKVPCRVDDGDAAKASDDEVFLCVRQSLLGKSSYVGKNIRKRNEK